MKRVFKVFVDFDKEERWLNSMATQGHLVSSSGPLYAFTPVTPHSAVVRIDFQPNMSAADFDDYTTLFADSGWQHVSGSRTTGNQYFASMSRGGDDKIFSESDANVRRYRRALRVGSSLTLAFLFLLIVLWSTGNALFETVLSSPKHWYLTPGLWERQGWNLLGGFLLETPFVAFRVGLPFLLIVACLVMVARVAYLGLLYRRAARDHASV